MKALKLALAISLVLNLALCWKVWWEPGVEGVREDSPGVSTSVGSLSREEMEVGSENLEPYQNLNVAEPMLAPSLTFKGAQYEVEEKQEPQTGNLREVGWGGRELNEDLRDAREMDRPYAEPLPSNPYAVPLWERRVPYREGQMDRVLLFDGRGGR
ncbi:MAG: hypothetical protein ACAI34_08670 [Verrucomicrobium sp.]